MNKEEVMIIALLKEKEKLKKEICDLKEKIEQIDNMRAFWSIKNMDKQDRIDKAIKIMEDYTLFDLKADKVMKVIKILKGSDVNE